MLLFSLTSIYSCKSTFPLVKPAIYVHGSRFKKEEIQVTSPLDKNQLWNSLRNDSVIKELPVPSKLGVWIVLIMEKPGGTLHLYKEESGKRKTSSGGRYHQLTVTELATVDDDDVSYLQNAKANLEPSLLETICEVINSAPNLSYRLFPVIGSSNTPPTTGFFDGVYAQRSPCGLSEIINIRTRKALPVNEYHENRIHCLPDGSTDNLLTDISSNSDTSWYKKKSTPPAVEKPAESKTDSNAVTTDSLRGESFPYVCDKDYNFFVTLHRDKKGDIRSVSVNNQGDKKPLLLNAPGYSYLYDPLFNTGSFERWLKIHYPKIGNLCAGELAFEIHLRDSSFIRCLYCKPATVPIDTGKTTGNAVAKASAGDKISATDTTKSSKKPSHFASPGSISIIRDEPFIMTPSTSKSPDTIGTYIPLELQLAGTYDSTANKIPFQMKFGHMLANNLKLQDTSLTITHRDWDSAVRYNNGRLRVELAVKYTNTKDSLSRIQEDYIVIADSTQSGKKKIQLRNYDPSSAFWMEMGSNFELLNGLTPRNIYAGILLFDKDATKFSWPAIGIRNWNISFMGGAYESLTSSSAGSADSGIIYRDNSSYTFNATRNGYPAYHDTGVVTVTAATKNIGLFFAPAVRLSEIPADHNGAHIFISLYSELLWQTVTMSNDYSKLVRDSSLIRYLPDTAHINRYRYKQNASTTSDYRTTYIGLGVPFYLKRKAYTFFLNPAVGTTNQKFIPIRPNADPRKLAQVFQYPLDSIPSGYPYPYLQPRCSWNPFYLIQFRFNEEKYDITVTGEIRGLFLRNSSPLISLTLSKKFDLGNLLNSILAPVDSNK